MENPTDLSTETEKGGNKWRWKGVDIRQVILMTVGLLSAFIIGWQAKTPENGKKADLNNSQSNTKQIEQPKTEETETKVLGNTDNKTLTPPAGERSANCPIKGNISGKNKIYHTKDGVFYERTQEEICFQTESEAVSAGFRKSQR